MTEKFNKKYSKDFSQQQIDLLSSKLSGDDQDVLKKCSLIKLEATSLVEKFYKSCDNSVLNDKKIKLKEQIENYEPDSSDISISRALMLSSLIEELGD